MLMVGDHQLFNALFTAVSYPIAALLGIFLIIESVMTWSVFLCLNNLRQHRVVMQSRIFTHDMLFIAIYINL